MKVDRATVAAARRDPAVFAEVLVGEPLWPHQLEVVHSPARYRCLLAGRQSGKSRTLGVLALHKAFTVPNSLTLLISAGETASRDLLASCAVLAQNPLLSGSLLDETKGALTLTNGSEIRSVPPSQRRIRGLAVDRLVVDEGCWVASDVWVAAQFTTIARPGSDIIVTSTPWGRQDGWLAQLFRDGEAGEEDRASWRWPSQASPLVDQKALDTMRHTMTDREYASEVEAIWQDDAGAFFATAELEQCMSHLPVLKPSLARGRTAWLGVDWGYSVDASAVVVVEPSENGYAVPYCQEFYTTPYDKVVEAICDIADPARGGWTFSAIYSEQNGVGQGPTQLLQQRLMARGVGVSVTGVSTTSRSKEDCFGRIKLAAQQKRLKLPDHPALIKQLGNLQYETSDAGLVRIHVPANRGHDDLAMALCLAASGITRASRTVEFFASFIWTCGSCRAMNGQSQDFCTKCARRRGDEPVVPGDADPLLRSWSRW